MLKFVYGILSAVLILAGCAETPAWVRPNTGQRTVDDALSQCRTEARALLREQTKHEDRIFNDRESIVAASGYGSGLPTSSREMNAGRQRERSDTVIAACMHRQGFTLSLIHI